MGAVCLILFAAAIYVKIETEAVPVLSPDNSHFAFLKDKSLTARLYPHRTMMLTGYYKPRSRTYDANRATNVYAQGHTIGGGTYLGGLESEYLNPGLHKERPVSSSEAEAAPDFDHFNNDDTYNKKNQNEEPTVLSTIEPTEETPTTLPSKRKSNPKKKKIPVFVDQDEEDNSEEEDYEDVPVKGNKRNRGYFPFNTFFPMVFSFPGVSSRSGTSASMPGTITAVANSYSTARGGVASSVATAYGGNPNGKTKRQILSNNQQ